MHPEQHSRPGGSFQGGDVVENYVHRPPYADSLFDKLAEIVPSRHALLDIGCGPGKISRPMSRHFDRVTAVDPSREMIALGRSLDRGNAPNIEWVAGFAEAFDAPGPFDLTVAASSLHWMDHARLFPHLRALAGPGHVFAVVSGDDAFEPPWQADWRDFLARWVPMLTGRAYDPQLLARQYAGHEGYLDIRESCTFVSAPFTQTIADFIACQHSRETFAPSRMGGQGTAFDAELADLLRPHAIGGKLRFCVLTSLDWGVIRDK